LFENYTLIFLINFTRSKMKPLMKPHISKISEYKNDQAVVCIVGKNSIPDGLFTDAKEKGYAERQITSGEDRVFINSYDRCICIVKPKDDVRQYKVREEVRRAAYKLRKQIKAGSYPELVITSFEAYDNAVVDFAEGLLLSIYSFDKYITRKNEGSCRYPEKILLHSPVNDESIKWLEEITDSVYFARDLINEPVIHLNAVTFAEEIKKAGESAGCKVEILNKGKIEALKMGGLLAVNRGSIDPPSFSILEWKPENHVNSSPVVLVGKGVVYDTGGLNIKTGDFMSGMKGDMAGGAIVTGVIRAVAKAGIPVHVIGLIPSTDNRPGGNAYAQGDVITMHNKMTVEIGNTDAEGRLILADAISYASRYKPGLIIDVATLTGSAAMTFSNQAIAMMSNADRKYTDLLTDCGNEVYERVAPLPFFEEYAECIKSDIADIKNVSNSREAGAITAGKFLEKFAEYPLIHLDIAGVEFLKKDEYYRLKNGTATGLRLLAEFLKRLAAPGPK
jgi:leucyl aminopeptidase